jgi:hypothetical protein
LKHLALSDTTIITKLNIEKYDAAAIGNLLDGLRRQRNIADHDEVTSVEEKEAYNTVYQV